MNWMIDDFYIIDRGDGTPTLMECSDDDVAGYALALFTNEHEAIKFAYTEIPDLDRKRIRLLARKTVEDVSLPSELIMYARQYGLENLNGHKMLGAIVNPHLPVSTWIPIRDLITLGVKPKPTLSAIDELVGA